MEQGEATATRQEVDVEESALALLVGRQLSVDDSQTECQAVTMEACFKAFDKDE